MNLKARADGRVIRNAITRGRSSKRLEAADVVLEDYGAGDDVRIIENRTGVKLVGVMIIVVGEVSVRTPVKVGEIVDGANRRMDQQDKKRATRAIY
ncbi:MAG TPA: hypothetical protein VNX70_17965 [Bryobacteraceae bacterium]|nr:hypothetical protein [Bryobacteraceae bacterium]